MSSIELANRLSAAAVAYQSSRQGETLARLAALVREAAAHVHRVGEGTVDHIVLSSALRVIVSDIPALEQVLGEVGWNWSP